MSVAVVRKPSWYEELPFVTAAEEFRDSANETTHSLLLVRLHRKSLLFPDIYYDRYGHHFTLMHDTSKGYSVGDLQVFLGAQLHNAYTSRKGPSPKAKLLPAFLDRPAGHPLVDSCTREYRDWTKDFPALAGSKTTLEEHFVWLSTSHQPYTHDPGSPFVSPDFTLGLPPVRDWPRQSGEPPWPLDPKDHPKPKPDLAAPADSTRASSPDENKKRRKKKKHRRPRRSELKVTTRGLGTNDLVWTNTGSAWSSSSTASSHSEGDSGLGSNLRVTDTEAQTRAPLRPSPDARGDPSEVMEDAPLSDRDGANKDFEMVDAEVILPITCSFQHQMDEMAINLLFPGSQLVPNVWSACHEVLEGLSLVAPLSCSPSWPASLVERVAPVPGTSGHLCGGQQRLQLSPVTPGQVN